MPLTKRQRVLILYERDVLIEKIRKFAKQNDAGKTAKAFNKERALSKLLTENGDIREFIESRVTEKEKKYYRKLFSIKKEVVYADI